MLGIPNSDGILKGKLSKCVPDSPNQPLWSSSWKAPCLLAISVTAPTKDTALTQALGVELRTTQLRTQLLGAYGLDREFVHTHSITLTKCLKSSTLKEERLTVLQASIDDQLALLFWDLWQGSASWSE